MTSVRCPHCGLVNWANAEACKRCQGALQSFYAPAQPAQQPYGYQPAAQGYQQHAPAYQQTAHNYQQAGYGPQQHQTAYNYQQPAQQFQPPENYGPYPSYADYWSQHRGGGGAGQMELASRGSRLAASLIDDVCMVVPVMVAALLFFAGVQASGAANSAADDGAAIGVILFFLLILAVVGIVQLVFLTKDGQTIGKKILNIKIVKADTGENGGFTHNALLRSIAPNMIGNIPYVGFLFTLVDVLFIFRQDRRCIHDLMAGTCVVKKSA